MLLLMLLVGQKKTMDRFYLNSSLRSYVLASECSGWRVNTWVPADIILLTGNIEIDVLTIHSYINTSTGMSFKELRT